MKLVVTAFVTVDGIIEAPGFDEHRSGRNAWALRVQTDADQVYNKHLAMSADAFLLGRRTWQIWAAFWPTQTAGDPELTEWMNSVPKYVVSNTLKRADWNNTTIISGDVAAQVANLKAKPVATSSCSAARISSTSCFVTIWSMSIDSRSTR